MACTKSTGRVLRNLNVAYTTSSTDYVFFPVTDWMPAGTVNTARFLLGTYGSTPNNALVLQQAVQYAAARPDQPGDWSLIGANTIPRNEYRVADLDVASGAGTGSFWVRFGIAIRQSGNSSSNVTTVPTWHQVDTSCRGKLVAVKTLDLQPMGGNRFEPITGWLPGVGITGLSYAFVVTSYATDLSYKLVWRFRNDITENDAGGSTGRTTGWDGTGSAITPGSLNTTHTNLVSLTTAYQEVQFGVLFTGTTGNANISVALCLLDD